MSDVRSHGIPDHDPVLMELQYCAVRLHLHPGRHHEPCLEHVRFTYLFNRNRSEHGFRSIVVGIGQTLLMMSLAEYASIWPQAGGQQFFTQMVAPENWKRFLSYVVGWCVLIGEISTSSSCAVNSAQILEAFVEVTHPDVAWKVCIAVALP